MSVRRSPSWLGKKRFAVTAALVVLSFLLLAPGCPAARPDLASNQVLVNLPSGGGTQIEFGKAVTLKVGESVTYADGLVVKLEAINDSRCPQGVQCIWAGELASVLILSGGELASQTEIRLGTLRAPAAEVAPYGLTLVGATTTTVELVVKKGAGGR